MPILILFDDLDRNQTTAVLPASPLRLIGAGLVRAFRGQDLNLRPSAPKADALSGTASVEPRAWCGVDVEPTLDRLLNSKQLAEVLQFPSRE